MTARVAIVEDHALVADMLASALARRGIAAAVVHCPREEPVQVMPLVARIRGTGAEVVLLDLDLGPSAGGVDVVGPLTRAGARVLVVSGVDDLLLVARALEAGAIGFRSKAEGFEALVAATRALLDGAAAADDEVRRARLLAELRRHRARRTQELAPFRLLTEREQEVLHALADGRSVADIARDWTVSDTTVRAHVRGILTKLGASSQLGAVAKALRAGWLGRDRPGAGRAAG